MQADNAGKILTNLRKGPLEYCVLALLQKGQWYGLDLARTLMEHRLLAGEGTLYPLLARLRRSGLVDATWRESPAGPPRRYYVITDQGRTTLAEFRLAWAQFRTSVDTLIGPGDTGSAHPKEGS